MIQHHIMRGVKTVEDKIFISYSHSDYEVVSFIANKIQQVCDGREIWYDGKLRGGEHYFSTIATQIMDCNFFVFMVSKDSVTSDWCLRELEFAASEKKNSCYMLAGHYVTASSKVDNTEY